MHCSVYDEHSLEKFQKPKPKITKICVEMNHGDTTVRLPPIITSYGNVPQYLVENIATFFKIADGYLTVN